MNVLSLFAGIGGLELGLERAGMTTVGQVEINRYCRTVLDKHWPGVPKHDDVRTAPAWWASQRRPAVQVVCGGFPCQPFPRQVDRLHAPGNAVVPQVAEHIGRLILAADAGQVAA